MDTLRGAAPQPVYPLRYSWRNGDYLEHSFQDDMEFRLVYQGPLASSGNRSSTSRVEQKHAIRKTFHPQLAQLWETHPGLKSLRGPIEEVGPMTSLAHIARMNMNIADLKDQDASIIDELSRRFAVGGFNFVPLVNTGLALVCGLDILFLRHEEPGALVTQGGDIDGRIKTLLDALRMPKPGDEVAAIAPSADENPFYCLLEEDTLITDLRVITDRLLTQAGPGHAKQDVMLVIQVTVKRTVTMWENLPLL